MANQAPKFVILGTGRSGSQYVSAVLRRCGINCGHEEWFTGTNRHTESLDGDSSWLACLDRPRFSGTKFQQVRDPLACIASLVRHATSPQRWNVLHRTHDPLMDACRAYYFWNLMCEEETSERWKVEEFGWPEIERIASVVSGKNIHPNIADQVLKNVPRNLNNRGPIETLTWGDLPRDWITDKIVKMAQRYGYKT